MEVAEFLEKLSPDEKRWLDFVIRKRRNIQVKNPKDIGYNPTGVATCFFNPQLMRDEKWSFFALYPITGLSYRDVFDDDCCYLWQDSGWVKKDDQNANNDPVAPAFKWICVDRPDDNGEPNGQNIITMVPVCENIDDMFAYMTYLKDSLSDPLGLGRDITNGNAKIADISFTLVSLFHFREKHHDFRFYLNYKEDKKVIEDLLVSKFGLQNTWPHQLVNWLKAYPFDNSFPCLTRWEKDGWHDNDLEYLLQ